MSSSLLNKKQVRQLALAATVPRYHRFSRVSAEFYPKVEAAVRRFVTGYVAGLPSKGMTIK